MTRGNLKPRNFLYLRFHLPIVRKRERLLAKEVTRFSLVFRIYNYFFPSPLPPEPKRELLKEIGGREVWIETGTYLGQTAKEISKVVSLVHTIEPSSEMFTRAKENLKDCNNVVVHHASSEDVLERIVESIKNKSFDVTFWLDGHFSGLGTYNSELQTPIRYELDVISRSLKSFSKVVLMIDDIRCFDPKNPNYTDYPDVQELVSWAIKNEMTWYLKSDIFVATYNNVAAPIKNISS
jgi:SAM-dependent methyltransferase